MKNFIKTTVIALGITLIAANASAAETKIGIIDSQKIMEQSSAAKSIRDQVTKKADVARNSATEKEKKLKESFQSLENQKKALSKEAFEEKNAKLIKEAEELNKAFYTERMTLEKSATDAMAKIEAEIISIVDAKAKEKGLNLVLVKAAAVFNDASLDVTDEVLKLLNTNLPDVKLTVEKASK